MVYTVIRGPLYLEWFQTLRDPGARARILRRIDRFSAGNPGDVKPVGEGVGEMRIDYGPGYRIYYKRTGRVVFLLLCGGDKSSQERDIRTALKLAKELPK